MLLSVEHNVRADEKRTVNWRGAYLLRDGFFGAEEFIQAAFLDLFKEGSGDVNMGIERCLSRS